MRTNPGDNDKLKAKIDALMLAEGPEAVIATLTGKMRSFVEEYIKDFKAVDALERAGYGFTNAANARKAAFNMLAHPAVKVAVKYYTEKRADKVVTLDVAFIIDKILAVIEKAEQSDKPDFNAILRACELLGRHKAMFTEKVEHTGADGGPIQHEEIREEADRFKSVIDGMAKRHQQETAH